MERLESLRRIPAAEDVPVGKLVRCKVQCLVGTVCPTFLRGAINDRPGVRVT